MRLIRSKEHAVKRTSADALVGVFLIKKQTEKKEFSIMVCISLVKQKSDLKTAMIIFLTLLTIQQILSSKKIQEQELMHFVDLGVLVPKMNSVFTDQVSVYLKTEFNIFAFLAIF